MVQRNIVGTVAIVLPMMECMGVRRYGKIASTVRTLTRIMC